MAVFLFPLLLFAFAGHLALWTWLYNRLHASGMQAKRVKKLEKYVVFGLLASLSLPVGCLLVYGPSWLLGGEGDTWWLGPAWWLVCCSMLAYVSVMWMARRLAQADGGLLLGNDTRILDVRAALGSCPAGDRLTRWRSRIPGNQILTVHLQRKCVGVRGLPSELTGLKIVQLSDLHMTGQLQRPFFDLVVAQTNALGADVVAVTGDLVDDAACIEWIPATLGRLQSRYGTYVVFGNHEQRLDNLAPLRKTLMENGLFCLGGRSVVREIRGIDVLLAGNACPWFPPPPPVSEAGEDGNAFSILLSHSPDTLPWARRRHFNLMLAGHTHGGQIRFPVIGPVVCPSRYGVRFASGLFDAAPVVLHVSRGLSGTQPLRFNCPPEITLLELRPLGG